VLRVPLHVLAVGLIAEGALSAMGAAFYLSYGVSLEGTTLCSDLLSTVFVP